MGVVKTDGLGRMLWTRALQLCLGPPDGLEEQGSVPSPGACSKVPWVPPPEMPVQWVIPVPSLGNPEEHLFSDSG